MPTCEHDHPGSTVQRDEHPSSPAAPPSSHSSTSGTTIPSPHSAGGPRWITTLTISPATSVAWAAPEPTTRPSRRPSTRTTRLAPASASGRRTTRLSPSLANGRAASGRTIGAKASVPFARPENESWSTSTS